MDNHSSHIPAEVRVVSPHGDGTHRTIAAALIDATSGTRIIVRPGTYTAPLIIDTPVEIVGEGSRNKILVSVADGHCVVSRATDVALRHLTIRNKGSDEYETHAAVRATAGTLGIEDCHIESAISDGVAVDGERVTVTIRRCHIVKVAESAIHITRRAQATAEDCVIELANTGTTIRQGGILTMARCTIRSCSNAGLSFYEYGSGTVEDCTLEGMGAMGIGILQGSDPAIRRCTLRNGEMNGIGVLMHGLPLIEDCVISGHGMEGIVVRDAGNPIVRRCKIADSTHVGIGVYERGQGQFEDCEITGNMYGGVALEDAGTIPILRRCRFYENDNFGFSSDKGAHGLLDDCEILATRGLGIHITGGAEPVVKDSLIADGHRAGVLVTEWARGRIEGCRIEGNGDAGVLISDEADPSIVACHISDNGDAGVWVNEYGRGNVDSCDIARNAEPGIRITRGGDPLIQRCRIHDGRGGGIITTDEGRGRVEECEQVDNAPTAFQQDADSVSQRTGERQRIITPGNIVFCTRIKNEANEEVYGTFFTEDDARLLALAHAVGDGRMSPSDACESWTEIFGEPLNDAITRGGKGFPRVSDLLKHNILPARSEFCTHLHDLDIPGIDVARECHDPAMGYDFCVKGADALVQLGEALRGDYEIVVWTDQSYLTPRSLVEANRLIRQAQHPSSG